MREEETVFKIVNAIRIHKKIEKFRVSNIIQRYCISKCIDRFVRKKEKFLIIYLLLYNLTNYPVDFPSIYPMKSNL